MGPLQYTGEACEKGRAPEAALWPAYLLQTVGEVSGLNSADFEMTFQLVDCVSLSETLP